MPSVNLLAVLLATISAFMIGGIWYGPLFGKAWMTEHGFTAEQIRNDFNPAKTYGTTFVLAAITAWTFAIFLGPGIGWSTGGMYGLIAGLCWVTASIATNYQFEGTSNTLLLINGGYHTVRFAVMGAILGAIG
ncbi:MAG: DUF1761 domain-containing protein [Gemmatimonadetes bacterium]|nr:DUF1761 domain-containing protein [Gemmatimonadota bacterium]MCA9768823.1 DUF1761 domain-containing protein [Gemmatimonadota bacterium]MCB9504516.1 DUF1761 domain-containing protein [Gemmatimonadales bacterium]MCB9518089.1 DUF1761 domain-containing protein [Gemmatimonadales bacterium]